MLSKKTIRWFLIGFLLSMSFSAVTTVFAETKTCSVTLKKSPKTKKKTIQTGDSIVLTLKYKKRVVSSDKAVFTSTKPAVAEVSADGVITARNTGKTYIYARYKKALAKIRITVKAADTSASAAALADTDEIIYFTEDTTEKMLAVKTVSTKSVTSSANSSLRTRIVEYAPPRRCCGLQERRPCGSVHRRRQGLPCEGQRLRNRNRQDDIRNTYRFRAPDQELIYIGNGT